jgi:hypothetical protein
MCASFSSLGFEFVQDSDIRSCDFLADSISARFLPSLTSIPTGKRNLLLIVSSSAAPAFLESSRPICSR